MKQNLMKQKLEEINKLNKNNEDNNTQNQNSWLDKLKPSNKNMIMKEKIFSKITEANSSIISEKEKDKDKRIQQFNQTPEAPPSTKNNNNTSQAETEKWDTYINNLNKNEVNLNDLGDVFDFDINEQSVVEKNIDHTNFSVISENIGDFDCLIGK